MKLFKKNSPLFPLIDSINPFHQDSLFKKLTTRMFPKREENLRRKKFLYSLAIFLALNLTFYLSLYNDYLVFGLSEKSFSMGTELIDKVKLGEMLSTGYAKSDSPKTAYGYMLMFSVLAIFGFIELLALRKSYQQFGWKPTKIIKGVFTFIFIHILYLVPIYPLMVSQSSAINSLIEKAKVDVVVATDDLAKNSNSDQISYGVDAATVKILLSTESPKILSGIFEQQAILNYLGVEERDTFYKALIIPSAVSEANLSIQHNVLLFPSNKIAISNATPIEELNTILTVISIKSVKESIVKSQVSTKKEPDISFLDELAYNELENEKLEIKKKQFQAYVDSISKDINDNRDYIKNTEGARLNLISEKSSYEARVRPILRECISTYSAPECQEITQVVDGVVDDYDNEIRRVEGFLEEAKGYLVILNKEYSLAKNAYEQFLAFPILPELQAGIYEPPNNILIKYQGGDNKGKIDAANYYYTLLHELVHYYSYTTKDDAPKFIEEGMTDLLALKIGSEYASSTEKRGGYPEEIQISSKIFDLLGDENAIDLFFKKSKTSWEKELDKKCGTGCYKKLVKIGDQLTYAKPDDFETKTRLLNEALLVLGE